MAWKGRCEFVFGLPVLSNSLRVMSLLRDAPASGRVCASGVSSLAGCPASRAALRRPSTLLVIRQAEGCFRLAGRLPEPASREGLGRRRRPASPPGKPVPGGGSPESPPPPRCRSRRCPRRKRAVRTNAGGPLLFLAHQFSSAWDHRRLRSLPVSVSVRVGSSLRRSLYPSVGLPALGVAC